jgi:fibronectin type 3 domain-containing protein
MITDVAADVTSYSFSGLEDTQVYRFKVKAYVLTNTTYQWGLVSEEGACVTTPAAVGGLTAKYKSSTAIALSWDKVARATGYQIYRLNTKTRKYEKIATVKGASTVTYKNSGLSGGKEYTYQVRAYKSYDGENYYGSFSDAAAGTTGPAKVGSLKLTTKSGAVTLKWSKVSGATGYQIYRLNTKTKKYEKIKTVKGAVSYKNTKLKKGTTYKYKVRAYRTYRGVTYYGSFSASQKIKAK